MRYVIKSQIMTLDLITATNRFNESMVLVENELIPALKKARKQKTIDDKMAKLILYAEFLVVYKTRIQQLDSSFDDGGVVERVCAFVESKGKTLNIP